MKNQLTTGLGGNSISMRDGAGALFRRKALVLFIFVAVVLGTGVVTFLLPNKYDSRMKILVKNQRVDVAITPEQTSGAPAPAVENDVSENQINSEIELLTSKDLLTQVVKDSGLARLEQGWLNRERFDHHSGSKSQRDHDHLLFDLTAAFRSGPEKSRRAVFGKTPKVESPGGRL